MRLRHIFATIALCCTAVAATTAHAAQQSWYLLSTITSASGTPPPNSFGIGQTLAFELVFNTSVPSFPDADHAFLYAGNSFIFEGHTSVATGHVYAPGPVNKIDFDIDPEPGWNDIYRLSFTETNVPAISEDTVAAALASFSNIQPLDPRNPQLTVYFRDGSSVTATPFYFAPVPEPATYGLALAGIAVIAAAHRARRAPRSGSAESWPHH